MAVPATATDRTILAPDATIETPALIVSEEILHRNIAGMAAFAKSVGVGLRPHIKTHKNLELGRRQLSHGAQGITVSTLVEAEAFARGGFTDITWAFPLDPTHIPHVKRIATNGVTLRVITDDLETAQALRDSRLHVWLKVDCGYHRAGVDPSSRYALEVARELGAERGLTFDGIL
jgi:D-serine deaminase-like pyridoxal phosphate-dependent protein